MNTGKLNKDEKDSVLLVLNEFAEEYKTHNKVLTQLGTLIKQNNILLTEHLEKSRQQPVVHHNTNEQLEDIESQLLEIRETLLGISALKQEKRILLFPEENAKEYYSSIFRWLLYIIIATYGFLLLKYVVEMIR